MRRVLFALLFAIAAIPVRPSVPSSVAATCASSVGPGIPPPATVRGGIPGYHAAWYGQSGYMSLCPGDQRVATVAFYNSGSLGWLQGRMGQAAYLGTWVEEPGQDQPSVLGGDGTRGSPATGWPRYDRVAAQPAAYVGPTQVAWFQFTVVAPATPGTYRLGLRPLIEGSTWMEDYGVFWDVTVLNLDGTAPRATPHDPPGFTVRPGTGLNAQDIHDVHEGAARVSAYLRANAGGDRSRPAYAVIRVGSAADTYCCLTFGSSYEIVTSNPAWRTPSAAAPDTWSVDTERVELSAHEYVHVWQYEVGGNACMVSGARWISEGMPEALAYASLVDAGVIGRANVDTFLRRQLRTATYASLSALESQWPASAKPFAVAQLAIEQLVASRGTASLRDWCSRVGRGEAWRTAFANAFGESVDSFYSRYEPLRAAYAR